MANILETLAKIMEKGLKYSDSEGKLFSEDGVTSLLKKEYLEGIKNDTQDLSESFDAFKDRQIGLRFTSLTKITSGVSDMLNRKGFYGNVTELKKSVNALYGYDGADSAFHTQTEEKDSETKPKEESGTKPNAKKETSEKKKKPPKGGEQ